MRPEDTSVTEAFDVLKTYDWGSDRKALNPIDEAVVATRGDEAARAELEKKLLAALTGETSRSAKDYICRTLKTMGTAASAPALAALLPDEKLSHMARYALERIPAPEAAAAMRDALPKLPSKLKIGAIGSLGVRRDGASVAPLAALLADSDGAVAAAAANSLGVIGTAQSAAALTDAVKKADDARRPAIADACLACAESLLADGKKAQAVSLYNLLKGEGQSKHVRLAATRGLLAAAGKKE